MSLSLSLSLLPLSLSRFYNFFMAKISQQRQKNIANDNDNDNDNKGSGSATTTKAKRKRKSVPRDSPPQRSSIYRGVTRHRWTGRYEAHLWDKNCWNESQNKKGRQVYLGAYDEEEAAAHAYDLAALKYWGQETILNFPVTTYQEEITEMEAQSKEEYIGSLRRKSSGFSRGVSKYRGVARHHHNGRWEARIGRVFGNKYLYLGTYATQEEAATAYDMAAIEYRGLNAVTNFDLSRYIKWLRPNQVVHTINPNHPQPSPNSTIVDVNPIIPPPPPPAPPPLRPASSGSETTSSALGFLLQSSKFKEMLERTTVVDCSSTPPLESDPPPRRSFPDDIQTYFDCRDPNNYSEEGDDVIFGGLNAISSPTSFQCHDQL